MSNFEFGGLPNIDFSNIDLSGVNQDELRAAIGDLNLPAVGDSGLPPGLDIGPGLNEAIAAAPAATPTPIATTPVTTPVATTPLATPVQDGYTESAFGIIKSTLEYYGLKDDDFLKSVRTLWENKTIRPGDSIDDLGIQLRDTDAFKKRFPANATLAAAGKPQYSVSQYLRQEADYKARLTSAGMPPGFYDSPEDFQNWIANDVSPDEIQARIEQGYQAVNNASPEVVAQFQRLYGIKKGDLAAYFIDPERAKPTFDKYQAQREARAAVVANQAQQQAGISLTATQSEDLVRAGIETQQQAQAGFMDIQNQQQLFGTTTAEAASGTEAITQQEQIAGVFGTNAEARQKIEARKRKRTAEFQAGGSLLASQAGNIGLGTVGQ